MIIRICNHSKLTDAEAIARVSFYVAGNRKEAEKDGVTISRYEVTYKSATYFYTVAGGEG